MIIIPERMSIQIDLIRANIQLRRREIAAAAVELPDVRILVEIIFQPRAAFGTEFALCRFAGMLRSGSVLCSSELDLMCRRRSQRQPDNVRVVSV